MQAAPSRGRRKAPVVALASVEAAERCALSISAGTSGPARQDYLDALPIAAAVVCVSAYGAIYIDAANEHFRRIGGWESSILDRGPIAAALADFLEAGTRRGSSRAMTARPSVAGISRSGLPACSRGPAPPRAALSR